MKQLDVPINIDSIYTEARKFAAYQGKKSNEASGGLSYELLRITTKEHEMLDTYLQEIKGQLDDLLKQYLVPSEAEEGMIRITCLLPEGWDEQLEHSCAKDIDMIMTNYVAGRWMNMVKPETGDAQMATAEAKKKDLMTKIYYRARPRKREVSSCNCMEDW